MSELDLGKAEAQLDALIEKRAQEAEAANREAQAWAESAQRYDMTRARELRQQRADYHRHLLAVFEAQAERHRAALLRLIDGQT
jgi:hypothetical protein